MVASDVDGFADMVVLAIKSTLAPVLARLAVAESRLAALTAHEQTIGALRDRLLVMETKAAMPSPEPALLDVATLLVPLQDRVAVLQQRYATIDAEPALVDLRDRVFSIETKAALTLPPTPAVDISPLLERLAATEARLSTLGDLRDRVVVIETKTAQSQAPPDLGDLRERLLVIEARTATDAVAMRKEFAALEELERKDAIRIEGYTSFLQRDAAALSERIAVVETRAPVPGPAGQDGATGRDGTNGKDGADGLGFDDLMTVQKDDRSFTIQAARGERVKDIGTATFPVEIYRQVWIEGKAYERGDCVTWGGSEWHCNEPTTTKPGEGSKAWTLKVKRGRDGRDGLNAPGALPVVSVGPIARDAGPR